LTACIGDSGKTDTINTDTVNLIAELIPDAPELSITQVYHDALHFMLNGERVLVILLDGWGFEMFRHFEDKQPFLSGLSPQPALSVYPPLTPVALASIVTGVQPDIHGIHSRSDRRMNEGVVDIFAAAYNLGHTVAYVQGFSNIIETSLMPVLSPDTDGLYGTDNEVFENAKRNIDVDFLFVHFHGIDDEAHTYGPYADEVGARMALIDEYVRYLVENWGDGKIIITADHGLRRVYDDPNRLANHYGISREEMIVPYVIISSNSYNENATFLVTSGDAAYIVSMEDLLFIGVTDVSSSPRGVQREFTGVPLVNIFNHLNIDYSTAGTVIFTSGDGFMSAVSINEAINGINTFIVFEENGELLGTMEDGGRGPFMVVIALDQFPNRWARYLTEVKIQ